MSHITSLISRCFSSRETYTYEALSKKDDNFGIKEAEAWIREHQVDDSIRRDDLYKINRTAKKIIQDLKKVPITANNSELIKKHLASIATKSDLLRQDLIKYTDNLKGPQDIISDIQDKLIMICSIR